MIVNVWLVCCGLKVLLVLNILLSVLSVICVFCVSCSVCLVGIILFFLCVSSGLLNSLCKCFSVLLSVGCD